MNTHGPYPKSRDHQENSKAISALIRPIRNVCLERVDPEKMVNIPRDAADITAPHQSKQQLTIQIIRVTLTLLKKQ